ncbi:hypothetical protein AYI69_g867 [Smittium culicis]|uniref:Uncharacterized protein n=1 Tax=Smittium culicis TaxID=133412 RepID=A0A1R1YRW1_9FUNG|nr:hypothetical protein AYI69_g867 [Smittium culicis]
MKQTGTSVEASGHVRKAKIFEDEEEARISVNEEMVPIPWKTVLTLFGFVKRSGIGSTPGEIGWNVGLISASFALAQACTGTIVAHYMLKETLNTKMPKTLIDEEEEENVASTSVSEQAECAKVSEVEVFEHANNGVRDELDDDASALDVRQFVQYMDSVGHKHRWARVQHGRH